jgi:hypothetical protein
MLWMHNLVEALLGTHRWIEGLMLRLKALISWIETLLIESLLLHPWIKPLLPRIEASLLHSWIVSRCIPHSLQPTLSCMCVRDSPSNTSKTARGLLTEIICARRDDIVWIRISICVPQFSSPESTFCVSVRRGCCELWWTYGRNVAL